MHSEARQPLPSKGPPDGLRATHGLLVELLNMLGVVPLRWVVGEIGVAFEGFWGHCLCQVEAPEGKNK